MKENLGNHMRTEMPQIQKNPGFGSLGTKNTYSICSNCSLIDTLNKIL